MEFLIKLLVRNAWKFGETNGRLKEFARTKGARGEPLIPLEPLSNFLESLLMFFLVIAGLCLIVGGWIAHDSGGFSLNFLYVCLGFGTLTSLILLMLFNTDSRYVLDVKNRRIIYVFTFFVKLHESVLTSFSNIMSIELDSKEIGRTAAGSWQHYLVVVKKDLTRIRISHPGYSPDGLPETGQLIASVIQCPYKTGNTIEKLRIMGL